MELRGFACNFLHWTFSFYQVFSEGLASIVLLEDSITVEVIERGSAVHCISAYATWKHTMELQAMYAGYTGGTYAAPCRVVPGPRFVQVMQVDRWLSLTNYIHMQSLQDSIQHHPAMLPQTKSFRMPHACDMCYFLFFAAFITFIKEGDIVVVGSDGIFDNLYLVARCCEILVVILPHAAFVQWWHLSAFHFFQL